MQDNGKTYRARERGFVDGSIKEVGQLFTTKAAKGKWMAELDEDGNEVPDAPEKSRAKKQDSKADDAVSAVPAGSVCIPFVAPGVAEGIRKFADGAVKALADYKAGAATAKGVVTRASKALKSAEAAAKSNKDEAKAKELADAVAEAKAKSAEADEAAANSVELVKEREARVELLSAAADVLESALEGSAA